MPVQIPRQGAAPVCHRLAWGVRLLAAQFLSLPMFGKNGPDLPNIGKSGFGRRSDAIPRCGGMPLPFFPARQGNNPGPSVSIGWNKSIAIGILVAGRIKNRSENPQPGRHRPFQQYGIGFMSSHFRFVCVLFPLHRQFVCIGLLLGIGLLLLGVDVAVAQKTQDQHRDDTPKPQFAVRLGRVEDFAKGFADR